MSKASAPKEKFPEQFFFEKVSDDKERLNIFDLIAYERKSILVKTDVDYFSTHLNFTSPPSTFILTDKVDERFGDNFEGTIHFELRGVKYLCKGKFYTKLSTVKVDIKDLFFVQRRNSFRIKFPESHKINFKIESLNQKNSKIKCQVLDLSSKGLKLQHSEKLSKGDIISGHLELPANEPVEFKGKVRHCSNDAKNKNMFNIGIEFVEQTAESENFLFLYTLDLYRKIYRRKDV